MSAESRRTCPSCGNEFSGAMEFCPVCVLRGAIAGVAESGASSFEEAVKPTPDQTAQRYEHYELVTGEDGRPVELGRGAMGVTYKALDIGLGCPVALKIISERCLGDESARLRFLREARTAASLRHPNIASVLYSARSIGNYFYAMELVNGVSLNHLIKRSGQLELNLSLEIVTQLVAGLTAVHKKGFVHRDFKPSNILVSLKNGGTATAKIVDLGLAKAINERFPAVAISTPGAFAGTTEYASPEECEGLEADIRSNLYSLGVIIWEMLTGKAPFRGSAAEVTQQHEQAPLPVQLKGVPQPVIILLEALLERDPARRFQTPGRTLEGSANGKGCYRRGPSPYEVHSRLRISGVKRLNSLFWEIGATRNFNFRGGGVLYP
jgi:serine/threonine protein kinase